MFIGIIRCRSCESNVSSDDLTCPYCHTVSPARDSCGANGPWNWIMGGVFLVAIGVDKFWGLNLWRSACDAVGALFK